MNTFEIIALLHVITGVLAYVNHRYIKLPPAIGLMLVSMVLSGCILAAEWFVPDLKPLVEGFLHRIDFNRALMDIMLSFLLFAGALHVDLADLKKQKWVIGSLATFGVVTGFALLVTFIGLVGFRISMPHLIARMGG